MLFAYLFICLDRDLLTNSVPLASLAPDNNLNLYYNVQAPVSLLKIPSPGFISASLCRAVLGSSIIYMLVTCCAGYPSSLETALSCSFLAQGLMIWVFPF